MRNWTWHVNNENVNVSILEEPFEISLKVIQL